MCVTASESMVGVWECVFGGGDGRLCEMRTSRASTFDHCVRTWIQFRRRYTHKQKLWIQNARKHTHTHTDTHTPLATTPYPSGLSEYVSTVATSQLSGQLLQFIDDDLLEHQFKINNIEHRHKILYLLERMSEY